MSSKLESILPKFKSTNLKQLASLCGEKTSGRKTDLIDRLVALSHARPAKPPGTKDSRLILSIDLGIRNLGYSLIAPAAPSKVLSPSALTADDLRRPPRIHLHEWKRRELLEPSLDGIEDPDRYSPASLAIATDRLVRHDLLPLKPTHVLIERQRWRSGGAAAVQEWTLRVNTLEAMLHASLRTLRELGHWNGELVSMAPNRVTRFWPPPPTISEETPKTRSRSAKAVNGETRKGAKSQQNSKKYKIGVLTSWLAMKRGSEIILPANRDTEDAVKWFRSKLTRSRKKLGDVEDLVRDAGPRKLDDLTDSLLQGVAWLKWEENRDILLREEGLMRLLEEKLLDELEVDTLVDDV
ncbi:Cruciform cutting endonuclease 1, mitochondrial [Daldinia childiae]|uniref:Cruciform cutting endonuclease 1, mitochondrial n=1 Tax=Daldinia childiae TaxID=326645 RepID=UPI001447F6D1|nr:Cruciform cutting endonuclease 1, mitochondrial [Daldinia childiae]KAF3070516.1 Cruciform cutting endonuclease 1, mitochondrial [Daldinia childiae]